MNNDDVIRLKELLALPKKIAIMPHKNPDGDAMGSTLGLYQYLKKTGHEPKVIAPNDYPDFLKWLPFTETVLIYEGNEQEAEAFIEDCELIFTLDFNSLARVGGLQKPLEESKADFVMIDHHQQPEDYAVVTYSDVTICATSQMVFHVLEKLDAINELDSNIATCLYTGIMTDTGSFRFNSTTATTHQVIAHLIEQGANNAKIHQQVFDTNSYDKLQLLGTALNNLKVLPEYRTAYITLTQEELDKHNFRKGDTEGFVNWGLALEGIVFAAIFIENKQEGIIKISLRSTGDFSTNAVAREHFSGGGHINASGGKSDESLKDTVEYFISILPSYKSALHE